MALITLSSETKWFPLPRRLDRFGLSELARVLQPHDQLHRRSHGPDRVRTRWTDADLEQLKNTDGHIILMPLSMSLGDKAGTLLETEYIVCEWK